MKSSTLYKAFVPLVLSSRYALAQGTCSSTEGVKLTFYGMGSAGTIPTYNCPKASNNNKITAGDGSYDNPGLFATAVDNKQFTVCEIVYIPYFKKYFQYGDKCEQCNTDFHAGMTHLDLWIGPNPQPGWADPDISANHANIETAACEISWGTVPSTDVVQNPPTNLETQTQALDDGTKCYNADTSRFFPSNKGSCSGGSGSSSTGSGSGSPAPVSSPSSSAPVPSQTPQTQPQTLEKAVQPNTGATAPKVQDAVVDDTTQKAGDTSPAQQYGGDNPPTTTPTSTPTSTPSSTPSSTPTTTPVTPPVENKKVETTATPQNADTQQNTTATSTGGKAGDACPPNGWFEGCVWGSGTGQLGASCSAKTDCWGEAVCVTGKCVSNLSDRRSRRVRRSMRGYAHGHVHHGRKF
ncbi:MAG: hypothetical protein OHK93_007257 [Ramalina farinacea]|uniref:Uncharacterized protein n=1 Tax=Ramalina farinacea TaxID=258253 RepID=A0AA43TTV9_9LECA|nr:hypothetical protein [Ramalina farinacea]